MNITEQEDALFEKWAKKHEGQKFIKDGVPCPAEYEKAKIKITFVLKEANDFDSGGTAYNNDMRTWINRDGAHGTTWNNIIRWTHAILNNGCDYPQEVDLFDMPISFINLKKVNGGSQSDANEIKKYAQADAAEILEQLKIYKPDIIVCCGIDLVADCLADYVFKHEGEWTHCQEAYKPCCWFYTEHLSKTTAVLNCYHPLNLGTGHTNEMLFSSISKIVPKILKSEDE